MPSGELVRQTVLTLGVGSAGGLAFSLLGLPAAWLSGAMVAVSLAGIAGMPIGMPNRLRDVVFICLGVSMGAGVTPDVIAQIVLWPASIGILSVSVVAVIAACTLFFMRVALWDKATAFFASIPGALSTVLALALETSADVRRVAISQSLRVFILVAIMPTAIMWLRDAPAAVARQAKGGSATELVILLAAGIAGSLLFKRLRIPGAMLTGALAASAILHVSELTTMQLPQWLLIPGFVVLGCFIGNRFHGATWREIGSIASVSLMSFLLAMVFSVAGAVAVSLLFGLETELTLLAFAPGGLEAMMVMAFALDLDPAYVAGHQIFRFVAMAMMLPFALRLMQIERVSADVAKQRQ